MYNRFCKIAILSIIAATRVSAWGKEGHLIASHIATALLNKNGQDLVADLLVSPGEDFQKKVYEACVWPDLIINVSGYEWSKPLHFINIPNRLCDGFNYHRDCGAQGYMCTVSAIGNFSAQVADESLPKPQRADALKFLIHFLADVTQPLHIGFASDHGGNKITVTPPWDHATTKAGKPILAPRSKPLHVIWDSHMLQYMLITQGKTWQQWAEETAQEIHSEVPVIPALTEDPLTYASRTASATADLSCNYAYKEHGAWIHSQSTLSINYYHDGAYILKAQLSKAGIDIARFINMIADDLHDDMSTNDESGSGTTDLEDYEEWENAFASPDYEDEFHMFGP